MTVKFGEFDVSALSFEEVQLSKNKTVLLPKYDGVDCPKLRLPEIELTHYGVPKISQYFKTDKDRCFLQLPVSGDLAESFTAFDKFLGSNEMKHRLFKQPGDIYTYSPLLKSGSRGSYVKLKLETDYETDEIETFVFCSHRSDNGKIQRDPAPMDVTSVDSFASVVVLNSTVVCVIRIVKIWVIDKRYGVTIKLVRINVLPSEKKVVDCHDLDFDF